ncbi:hypothetical protein GCM10025778_15550 [Paeniglutamicibacter antarcticus]|uniref:Uncharacterized protein n=1 Tax=Paeniglutamicibacter antarcticus TaxID=494023 RepID=A0ABP9TMU5_9MICC
MLRWDTSSSEQHSANEDDGSRDGYKNAENGQQEEFVPTRPASTEAVPHECTYETQCEHDEARYDYQSVGRAVTGY